MKVIHRKTFPFFGHEILLLQYSSQEVVWRIKRKGVIVTHGVASDFASAFDNATLALSEVLNGQVA